MNSPAVKCVYVLHGDDAFLCDAHRKEILARAIGDADPQTCVTAFGADAELAEVLDELRTAPFLAPRRAVIIRDADAFVAAQRQSLEKYLSSPAPTGTLILMVSSWPRTTRLYKLVAKVGQVMDCSQPSQDSLVRRLRGFASERGKKLAADAAELLAEWIGRDLAAIDGEMEKLSLYVGGRDTITIEDVSSLVTATAGPAAFALTNAITAGDTAAALKALGGILTARGEEFKTLGLIAWHLRRAIQAQQRLNQGAPPDRALPKMSYHQRAPFLAMLKRRRLHRLQADFRSLIRADLAVKTGAGPIAALQQLVIGLCLQRS
ncbi:MAG: DNA polymerase III subunit delta [Planctomycetota bacterium]|nr:DNA polymerase III subunit delta [Planctomycetota bacterium]